MSSAAERAAEAGMEQALHAERVEVWKAMAERWLDEQPQGRLFTADDLRGEIGSPDESAPGRNNVVGAWINAQKRRKRIEFTGRMSTSSRVAGHGNLQRLWRVKDAREERAGGDAMVMGPHSCAAGVSSSSSLVRVGGDADRLGPDGVSSSPVEEGGAGCTELRPSAGASSGSAGGAIVAVSEEEEWEGLQAPDAGVEQLGLLPAAAAAARGAYSEEAA